MSQTVTAFVSLVVMVLSPAVLPGRVSWRVHSHRASRAR